MRSSRAVRLLAAVALVTAATVGRSPSPATAAVTISPTTAPLSGLNPLPHATDPAVDVSRASIVPTRTGALPSGVTERQRAPDTV